jgi:hypothetical protein
MQDSQPALIAPDSMPVTPPPDQPMYSVLS